MKNFIEGDNATEIIEDVNVILEKHWITERKLIWLINNFKWELKRVEECSIEEEEYYKTEYNNLNDELGHYLWHEDDYEEKMNRLNFLAWKI